MASETAPKTILIIGGSSGIGLATTKEALNQRFVVKAFSRSAKKMDLRHERLEKVSGDALDRTDVDGALAGVDAVVQALGVPLSPDTVLNGTSLFSEATAVLLPAMQRAGVKRLVSVTGFGAGDSKDAVPIWAKPGFKIVMDRIYRDKTIQERQIRETDLDWTIVRPTVLTSGRNTERYSVLTDKDRFRMGKISRADVASFIIRAVKEEAYIREAPVVTR